MDESLRRESKQKGPWGEEGGEMDGHMNGLNVTCKKKKRNNAGKLGEKKEIIYIK